VALGEGAHSQRLPDVGPQGIEGIAAPTSIEHRGDQTLMLIEGRFRVRSQSSILQANKGVVFFDRDQYARFLRRQRAKAGALPRRHVKAPFKDSEAETARKAPALLEPLELLGRTGAPALARSLVGLVRGLYAEGDVVLERDGVRILTCKKLLLSRVSKRLVVWDAELRIPASAGATKNRLDVLIRAPKLVQQGRRMVAYDAMLSPSPAGEPATKLLSKHLSITRHRGVFEFQGIGNSLVLGALPAIPLPDYTHYSDQENWIPIKGASGGNSDSRGTFFFVELGGKLNSIGQGLVDVLGGAKTRFRGEWRLRTGYMKKRGTPIDPQVSYELPGVFKGETDFYYLDDGGKDHYSPTRHVDGSPIVGGRRQFVRSRNRVHLSDSTRVDLELFQASDAAAYPEFRTDGLTGEELPETSVHVRHATENWRASLLATWNRNAFGYSDGAMLANAQTSQRPELRLDVFSQPLVPVFGASSLVVDFGVRLGRLRRQYADRSTVAKSEASFRADAETQFRTPFTAGDYSFSPYVSFRETWYSDTPLGRSEARESAEAGVLASTRLSRSFAGGLLGYDSLEHELLPQVRAFHRFFVSDAPARFYQFDEVDALDEQSAVDLILLQRLLGSSGSGTEDERNAELVWLDLEQRIHPNATRDNGGHRLGLFKWELIVRPTQGLQILFEGERDWNRNDFPTRNVGVSVSPFEAVTFLADWRSGRDGDGTGSFKAFASLWQRWILGVGTLYNFEARRMETTNIEIKRYDLDWYWGIAMSNDELTNDKSFRFEFRPRLEDRLRPSRRDYVAGDPAFGVHTRSSY